MDQTPPILWRSGPNRDFICHDFRLPRLELETGGSTFCLKSKNPDSRFGPLWRVGGKAQGAGCRATTVLHDRLGRSRSVGPAPQGGKQMCERERESERERERARVCVCVCERERESARARARQREGEGERQPTKPSRTDIPHTFKLDEFPPTPNPKPQTSQP